MANLSSSFLAFQARFAAFREQSTATQPTDVSGTNTTSVFASQTAGQDPVITSQNSDTGSFAVTSNGDTVASAGTVAAPSPNSSSFSVSVTQTGDEEPVVTVDQIGDAGNVAATANGEDVTGTSEAAAPAAAPTTSSATSISVTQSGGADPVVTVNQDAESGSFVATSNGEVVASGGDAPAATPSFTGNTTSVFVSQTSGEAPVVSVDQAGTTGSFVATSDGEVVASEVGAAPEAPVVAATPGVVLNGTGNTDFLRGGDGDDVISGNGGRDSLRGGDGNDILSGGAGSDRLDGGLGDDTFIFSEGDGFDRISNFDLLGNDVLQLDIDGIDSFDDFLGTLSSVRNSGDAVSAVFDFGGGDRLSITLESLESLTQDDFIFL